MVKRQKTKTMAGKCQKDKRGINLFSKKKEN